MEEEKKIIAQNQNGMPAAENPERGEACPACSGKHVKRTPEEQKALLTRLRRVEGQIRGIEKMVEMDAYCPDILIDRHPQWQR